MEHIERREGETLDLGGYSFAIAYSRGGRLVMVANSGMGETREEAIREARKLGEAIRHQEKIDKARPKADIDSN